VVCFRSWAVPSLLHNTTSTMLHRWGGMLQIMSSSFPSPYSTHHSGTSWSLSHLSDGHCSRTVHAFFRCCLANSNLVFLFLRFTNGLHLVINRLYLLRWSLLLNVDSDTDTPASWRVFFIWSTVVKGFSSPGKESFCRPPQLFCVVFWAFWCSGAHQCVLSL
jgi:hypothetical protein